MVVLFHIFSDSFRENITLWFRFMRTLFNIGKNGLFSYAYIFFDYVACIILLI